jgi:hypothetical protein
MGRRGLRRGGVLAGAAALLAGALAKAAERVARAADGEPLLLGRENAATGTTVLAQSSPASGDALRVTSSSGTGVAASGFTGVAARGVTAVVATAFFTPNTGGVGIVADAAGGIRRGAGGAGDLRARGVT